MGAEAAAKYPGKEFHEIEDDVALDYEKHQIGSALPWDHVRSASEGLPGPRSAGMSDSLRAAAHLAGCAGAQV